MTLERKRRVPVIEFAGRSKSFQARLTTSWNQTRKSNFAAAAFVGDGEVCHVLPVANDSRLQKMASAKKKEIPKERLSMGGEKRSLF